MFNGVTDYTQRGDFQVNANGNLVNGAGYYLMGVPVDPTTGNPVGNVPQVLQFQNNFVPAAGHHVDQYALNLPTTPSTTASPTGAAGSIVAAGGLDPADFTAGSNPLVTGTPVYKYRVTGTVITDQDDGRRTRSSATALSGAAGTDSLRQAFAAGNTITVDGTVLTFVASGATGNELNVTDSVGNLLSKIQSITGVAPSI